MAEIFVSHSRRDAELRDFLIRAFALATVKAVLVEFEEDVTLEWIEERIRACNAVFVAVGHHANALRHTQCWMVWESGFARALNKDIWVFEPLSLSANRAGALREFIIIPSVRHYVILDYTDGWLRYLRWVIQGYDDAHVMRAASVGGCAGAMLDTKDRLRGGVAGVLTGLALGLYRLRTHAPRGMPIRCRECCSVYELHTPRTVEVFRCPVCNTVMVNPARYWFRRDQLG